MGQVMSMGGAPGMDAGSFLWRKGFSGFPSLSWISLGPRPLQSHRPLLRRRNGVWALAEAVMDEDKMRDSAIALHNAEQRRRRAAMAKRSTSIRHALARVDSHGHEGLEEQMAVRPGPPMSSLWEVSIPRHSRHPGRHSGRRPRVRSRTG